jgi:hypothetical protein
MKKSTLMTGYLAAFVFLIAVIFKMLHYPGSGILITIGCVVFSLGYGIPVFLEKNKFATNSFQKFFNLFVLIMMLLIPAGFMFKIMHWPGAGIMIYVGNILLLIGIPLIIFNAIKSNDPQKKLNYHNEAIIFILMAGFSIFMLFARSDKNFLGTLTQVGHTVMTEMKYNEAKSNDLFAILENTVSTNPAGKPYLEKAKSVRNASDSLNIYITDLEKVLIAATTQTNGNPDSLETIKFMAEIKAIDTILFEKQLKAKELKEKLLTYTAFIGENTNSRGKDIITALFNIADPQPVEGDTLTWEALKFGKMPLATVILSMNQIKSNVRLLEAETMSYLQAMAAIAKNTSVEPAKK